MSDVLTEEVIRLEQGRVTNMDRITELKLENIEVLERIAALEQELGIVNERVKKLVRKSGNYYGGGE